MALIIDLKKTIKERHNVHASVECTYSVFTGPDGQQYLQLETYGLKERKCRVKTSQAIQLNAVSAAELKHVIEETFPSLR